MAVYFRLLLPIVFFAVSGFPIGKAQVAPSSTPVQPGSAEGRVTNSITGDLVPGATVRLMPLRYIRGQNSQPQTRSQADGSFRFESLSPGQYFVTAEAAGYVSNQVDTRSGFLTISAGQTANGVTVPLTPEGSITGRIEDEEGKGVPGAEVGALFRISTQGRITLKQGSSATSDPSGAFHLKSLAPGEYYVFVDGPEEKASQRDVPKKAGELVRTFYPHALALADGSTLQLAAGQEVDHISIQLQRALTYHVRGTISEPPSGLQVQKLSVTLSPREAADSGSLYRSAKAQPDGSFDFGHIVPGTYELCLRGELVGVGGGRRAVLLARQDIEVSASDLNNTNLTIFAPVMLAGHISLVGNGQSMNFKQVRIMAKSLENSSRSPRSFAAINGDGSFSLGPLSAGSYIINTMANLPGTYVKSVLLNQQDILNKEIDLTESGAGQLEVALSSGAGEIDGTVQDANSSAVTDSMVTAAIVIVPERIGPDGSGVMFSYGRADGSFSAVNVPPGKYLVYALDRADPNLWQNPDFLREMETQATVLQVEENGRQQVQLQRIAPVQVAEAAGRLSLTVQ